MSQIIILEDSIDRIKIAVDYEIIVGNSSLIIYSKSNDSEKICLYKKTQYQFSLCFFRSEWSKQLEYDFKKANLFSQLNYIELTWDRTLDTLSLKINDAELRPILEKRTDLNIKIKSEHFTRIDFSSFEELTRTIPLCDKCNSDLPIGRTVGLLNDSKVWAIGFNPALREIFRCIEKIKDSNGKVTGYRNKETYQNIAIDNSFFARLDKVNVELFISKDPMKNEYNIYEDYYHPYNEKIDILFKMAGSKLSIGHGIALTDIVKCFTKDINNNNFLSKINNCFPYIQAEIILKRPKLLFFTYFGAYDSFVKNIQNNGGIVNVLYSIGSVYLANCILNNFDFYLIRGTTNQNIKNDYKNNKNAMIKVIKAALAKIN